MTVRMATCREFATNFDAIDKLQKDYWMLKNSATPTALLLPWFPSIATRNKKIATKNLYKTLHECVEKRTTSTPSSDAIDVLLARGLSTDDTVRVSFFSFFFPSFFSIESIEFLIAVHPKRHFCRGRQHWSQL